MAETDGDNALLARGGGGLPGPVLVDPLNALTRGNQAAQAEFTTRGWQAKEAAGQAYQGAINPQTGEFDPNEFRRRLAASGPAAMEAGAALLNTQNISSNQLEQNLKKATWVNAKAGAVLQSGDFSDAAMLGIFQEGIANGALTLPEVQRQMQLLPHDAAGRERWLREHQMTSATVQQQLEQSGQTRQTVTTPQGTYDYTRPPPNAGTVFTPAGATPGSTTEATVPMDDQGIIPLDADGKLTREPKGALRWQKITVPVTAVPGVPGGGPPAIIPGTGTGATGGAQPPIPPPPGTSLKGGYQPRPASPTTPGPQSENVPPGASEVPSFVAAIQGGMERARAAPLAGGAMTAGPGAPTGAAPAAAPARDTRPPIFAAPPQGQPEKLKADVEAYTQDQAAVPAIATRSQNMGHAYEALKLLQSATGKGAAGINEIRSRLQTLGLLPAGAVKEQELVEIFTKYTERAMLDAAGPGTDLAKRMSEQSNPGTLLSATANFEFLRNDMAKTLQTVAAYKDAPDQTGNGYLKHRADVADKTDPRGFVWELYTAEEQARINKEVEGNKVASDKLHKAMGMARRLNLQIPGVTGAPPPQRQSFVAPPASQPNALMMTG